MKGLFRLASAGLTLSGSVLLAGTLLMTLLAASGGAGSAWGNSAEQNKRQSDRALRILFIGNSYTYFNNLPALLEQLAASSKPPRELVTQMVVEDGAQLRDHWEKGEAQKIIREGHWDFVILQDQSELGGVLLINGKFRVSNPDIFHKYARLFDQEIKKAKAKTVFFLTWAKKDAPEEDPALLNYAYVQIAKELGAKLAPVEMVWQKVRRENPRLNLYSEDGAHPNGAGSYLAANVIYATLYKLSPVGLPINVSGNPVDDEGKVNRQQDSILASLSKSDANLIQRTAWRTYQTLTAAGGYPSAPMPRPFKRPSVPIGRRPANQELEGLWIGDIKLYPKPAKMELMLRRIGNDWKAEAKITFGGKPDDITPAITDFTVTARGIAFVDSKGPNGGIVRYQAAFTGQTLSGVAEIIVEKSPIYGIGSWRLKRPRR